MMFHASPRSGCTAFNAKNRATARTTGGASAITVAMAPCCRVPPFNRRSIARAYRMKACSTLARHRNARHCSSPSAERIAIRFKTAPRSGLQLFAIAELLERLRVCERLDVFHWPPMHDVTHRELDDLVALRAWNVGDLHDLRRNMSRCHAGANVLADPVDERLIENHAVGKTHEQDHAHIAD